MPLSLSFFPTLYVALCILLASSGHTLVPPSPLSSPLFCLALYTKRPACILLLYYARACLALQCCVSQIQISRLDNSPQNSVLNNLYPTLFNLWCKRCDIADYGKPFVTKNATKIILMSESNPKTQPSIFYIFPFRIHPHHPHSLLTLSPLFCSTPKFNGHLVTSFYIFSIQRH